MAGAIEVVMTDPDWNERWALRRVGDCWMVIDAVNGKTLASANVDTEAADLCRCLIQSQKRLKLLRGH